MIYDIIPAKGHFEVYIDGEFYCTADDIIEAAREIDEYKEGI